MSDDRSSSQVSRRGAAGRGVNPGVLLTIAGVVIAVFTVVLFSHLAGPDVAPLSGSCAATATAAANVNVTPAASPPTVGATPIAGAQGLKYVDIVVGCGQQAQKGDTVTVIYSGWSASDGKLFDSSLLHDPKTFQITSPLGADQAQEIPGLNIGLIGMKVGGTRRLILPPALAYGAKGDDGLGIPPNATVIYDVTLVAVSS
ncbi:MAG: FKBP-type peptidyl-prolyl cis-trans isomerase [Ktedonobacterales bacterium]